MAHRHLPGRLSPFPPRPGRDLIFDYPLSSLPFVRDGRLRALGVNAAERLAIAQQIPTLEEQGVTGANLLGWAGLYAPARTPPPRPLPVFPGAPRA